MLRRMTTYPMSPEPCGVVFKADPEGSGLRGMERFGLGLAISNVKFAAASCEEYLRNIVKKHELTRQDKEDDRVRHVETLNAQTGPVFLTYRAVAEFDAYVASRTSAPPEIYATAHNGRPP